MPLRLVDAGRRKRYCPFIRIANTSPLESSAFVIGRVLLLRYAEMFRDVASLRSFSQAAKARGMSQPAVSHAMAQLEEYFGLTLIDRSKRPLALTEAGKKYYEGCQQLLDGFQQLEDSVREIGSRIAGRVRVAAIYSVGLLELSTLLRDFEQTYPEIVVDINYFHPEEVYSKVGSGDADFGIVSHAKTTADLAAEVWQTQRMVIVAPPNDEWAGQASIALDELSDRSFIALTPELVSRREIDKVLKAAGVTVRVRHEFDNVDTIRRAVADGVGVSILPKATVQREIDSGAIRAFDIHGERIVRTLGIVWRKHHPLTSAAESIRRAFLNCPDPEADEGDNENSPVP